MERTFRVRHYECDAYGHVNHTNYLRYMQEAAFDASAAAGYDTARYRAMKRTWLIRETDITYLQPLTYGDSVTVKTWVLDFRRVRSRRAAVTDWVYMDNDSWRPTSVPAEMIAAFLPNGMPEDAPGYEPFPQSPAPPPGVFTMRRPVEWHDIDELQHVNNTVYMAYLEECAVQVASSFGWPMPRMIEAGFGIVVRRYRVKYLQPAVFGDELEVSTWFSDVKRATAIRHYTIRRPADETLLVRAQGLWVWVDLTSGRPVRIPAHFLADFAVNGVL